jgi:hypothetical protein
MNDGAFDRQGDSWVSKLMELCNAFGSIRVELLDDKSITAVQTQKKNSDLVSHIFCLSFTWI